MPKPTRNIHKLFRALQTHESVDGVMRLFDDAQKPFLPSVQVIFVPPARYNGRPESVGVSEVQSIFYEIYNLTFT